MKCRINDKILSEFIDNALSEEKTLQIKQHMDSCNVCREKVNTLHRMNKIFQAVPEIVESEGFDFEFRKKLNEAISAQQEPNFSDIISEKINEITERLFVPRVPVLVKSAVTIMFLFAALFTGLYYAETGDPSVSGITGSAFIQRADTTTWESIEGPIVVHKGDSLKTEKYSEMNVALASKYYLRLKPNTVVKIAKLSPKHRHGVSQFDLKKGDLLVDIDKGYKGSKFNVKTPEAEVRALGTKFMMSSEISGAKTWVAVLEGQVSVQSLGKPAFDPGITKEVLVNAGMKTEVMKDRAVSKPLPLAEDDWQRMTELYMLGKKTRVALLISTDKNRVLELLAPCTIYIADEEPRVLPEKLEKAAILISIAISANDIALHEKAISKLEEIVRDNPKAEYNVSLLMFIGTYYSGLDLNYKAIDTFAYVAKTYPDSTFAPLALCAEAYIYVQEGQIEKARKIYLQVILDYPNSPDAIFAKERILEFKNRM